MAVSVFEDPLLSGLFGDEEIASCFSVDSEIAAMLSFEASLARAEGAEGVIPAEAVDAIEAACRTFRPDMDGLRAAAARDGVVVPELVRQLRAAVGEPHGASVHHGATSQDVIDTSLSLRLVPALEVVERRLSTLVQALRALEEAGGANALTGRTRMQAAVEMTAADRIRTWRRPLERRLNDMAWLRRSSACLQFAGAVGTLDRLGCDGPAVRARLADLLALEVDESWHSQRDRVAGLAGWLSLLTGSLGKLGQDVALMAQNGIDEIALSGGGGSSAMPHKQNPVRAELLVTLARFNAVQVAGMHGAMVHEQERSGAAWSLEWMILPQMVVAAGAALRISGELVASVQRVGSGSG